MTIYQKLAEVQIELKAPKNKKNTFGGYNYRSCEDILEALKPILSRHEALVTISDEIVEIGGRIYVKATAMFSDQKEGTAIQVTAYAREAESKKGMDDSQITGTASSYARKYALNGLLLIDDTKDADTDEYVRQTQEEKPKGITADQKKVILALADQTGVDLGKALGGKDMNTLTEKRADELIAALKEKANGVKG